jgi:5-methylcytosine-specific restriction enzyme A
MTTRTPMKRVRRNTGPTAAVAELVLRRDDWSCVRCGKAELQLHHRRPRGLGGTNRDDTNQPQNLLTLCLACHRWVESRRADAITNGWLVGQLDDPATVACLVDHESRYVYLTDSGEYSDDPPAGES